MTSRLPLLSLCLSYLMVILDATIVNVAMPPIGHSLHVGVSALQWTVSVYAMVFAALLLPAGALGDRFGSRRVFEFGLAWFTLTSAACALAPSAAALIAARVLQGLGAAALVPSSLALLRAIYQEPGERAKAIGAWGSAAGIGAAFGPVLGGLLVSLAGWRSVFLVNIPVGACALWLARTRIHARGGREGGGIDPPGQLTAIITLALVAGGVINAGRDGFTNPWTLVPLLLSIPAAAIFLVVERTASAPMLPLGVFREPALSAATAIGFAINLGLYGQLFVFSLYFQQQLGYSALRTGLALVPEGLAVAVAPRISGRLTARFGPRPPILAGLTLGAIGLGGLTVAGSLPAYPLLVAPLISLGLGIGMTMPAATTAVIGAVPAGQAGVAAALLNASRQVGSMLGVALLGSLVARASFLPGLKLGMTIAAGVFLAALAIAAATIDRPPGHKRHKTLRRPGDTERPGPRRCPSGHGGARAYPGG